MGIRMAYAIQCHKNEKQINMLIDSLDDKEVDFYIHIDKKSNIGNKINKKSNIFFVKNRIDVLWGNITQVEATLSLMREIKESNIKYDYVHLISGQDFPIKNKEYIKEFFIKNKGMEFIECREMPNNWAYGGMNRIRVYYPNFLFKNEIGKKILWYYEKVAMKVPFVLKKLPKEPTKFYGGSSWFSITGQCMGYILDYIEQNPKYYKHFRNSLCGDEVFFQSIFMNSQFSKQWINNNKRFIKWNEGSCSPKILTSNDFEDMSKSDKLFGRKFDIEIDRKILEILSEK